MLHLAGSRRAVWVVAGSALAAATFACGFLVGTARAPRVRLSPLDQAEQALTSQADSDVSSGRLTDAAIQAMVAALDDRWADYLPAGSGQAGREAIEQVLTGHYSGVGLWLAAQHGAVVVSGVVTGSPAAQAGLTSGDELVAVAGRPASALGVAGAVQLLRGAPGTRVRMDVAQGPGQPDRELDLLRRTLSDGAVSVDTVAPGIIRIAVTSFSAGVGSEVAAIVHEALGHHLQGIVLDLRGNPGGLLSEGLAVSSVFLDGGPVVTLTGRHEPPEVLDAAQGGDVTTPLAVLVNGGTASAAEVVAAALQQRGRAVVIGSRTFGKAAVQAPVQLSGGGLIEVTVARYRTPDGANLAGTGLTPDILVPVTAPTQDAVSTAVQVLHGLAGMPQIAPAAAIRP